MHKSAPYRFDPASLPLDGKVALVTASTLGVGLAVARALAAAGSAVVLNGFGRPEDIAETLLRIASDHHVAVRYSPADLARAAAIAGMIAMTLETFGRLDILVNNADLSAAFHTTRLALPAMRQNGFGRIINIAPANGLTLHALAGLTKVTALETAEGNITCNAIRSGDSAVTAAFVAFLASDAAASITGAALALDQPQAHAQALLSS